MCSACGRSCWVDEPLRPSRAEANADEVELGPRIPGHLGDCGCWSCEFLRRNPSPFDEPEKEQQCL